MLRRYFSIALGLLLVSIMQSVALGQEGTLEWKEITSPALEGNLLGDPATRRFAIYLPPSYQTSEDLRYPVFYMLHGTWETAGTHTGLIHTIDNMIQNGEISEMIAVFVDANNRLHASYYLSSVTLGDYETYITRDLVNYMDAHYRTIPHRNSRGITGYSMGGQGSMHLALKFPDVFGAVVAQAGFYNLDTFGRPRLTHPDARGWYAAALPNPDNPPDFFDYPYELVSGQPQIIPERYQKCVEIDVMHDVDRYLSQPFRLNGIKIVHGTADGLIPVTEARVLDKNLTDRNIDHVYMEHSGGHDFIAEESLSFFSDYLQSTTAVAEVSEITAVPLGYALFQNYPNPFNPETTIEYELSNPSDVRLSIYNLSGLTVSVPKNGFQNAGSYQIQWNGRNDSGEMVPSGVYFLELIIDGGRQVKRMVLTK
jgi:S-formylglutathione hydrolase FrmB